MASQSRIYNVTRHFYLKRKNALRAIEECACEWVEFGVSVRNLTLAESTAKRIEKARTLEPLPFAELPGLVFRGPNGQEAATRIEQMTAIEANQWARLQSGDSITYAPLPLSGAHLKRQSKARLIWEASLAGSDMVHAVMRVSPRESA